MGLDGPRRRAHHLCPGMSMYAMPIGAVGWLALFFAVAVAWVVAKVSSLVLFSR